MNRRRRPNLFRGIATVGTNSGHVVAEELVCVMTVIGCRTGILAATTVLADSTEVDGGMANVV